MKVIAATAVRMSARGLATPREMAALFGAEMELPVAEAAEAVEEAVVEPESAVVVVLAVSVAVAVEPRVAETTVVLRDPGIDPEALADDALEEDEELGVELDEELDETAGGPAPTTAKSGE